MARENDKVTLVKKGYEGRIGIVESVLDSGIYIIRLDDKELVKCLEDDFVVMEKEDEVDPTIAISRDDFLKVSSEVIAELTKKDRDPMFTIALGLTGAIVSAEIGKRLFNEEGGNNA